MKLSGRRAFSLCMAITLVLSSCSSRDNRARLRGAVTLDGEPLDKYQIVLIPADGPANAVAGTLTGPDGTYEIRDVLPGRYRVAISEFKGPFPGGAPSPAPQSRANRLPLPSIYSDPAKSELAVDLQHGRQDKDFALKSKP